jgi:TRAP-type C4-dicarboxylate transport system substrate-binding protein
MNAKARIICLFLCAVLLIMTAACGSSENAGTVETAADKEQITLQLATVSYSPGSTRETLDKMLEERIEEAFPGRIDVVEITPGSLGGDSAVFNAVQMGSADMCVLADMSIDTVINTLTWAFLPYMYTTYDDVDAHYYQGWVADEIESRINASGVVKVGNYESGFRNFANKVRPINSFDDFAGLKIRVPAVSYLTSFYEKLGTLPTSIDSSEVVTALEQGVVDGQDNNIVSYRNTGTIDLCPYVCMLNYCFVGGSMVLSQDFWNKLDAEEQVLFKEVCGQAGDECITLIRAEHDGLVDECVKNGVFTVTVPDEEMQAKLKEAAKQVWEEEGTKYDDYIMEKIYADFS